MTLMGRLGPSDCKCSEKALVFLGQRVTNGREHRNDIQHANGQEAFFVLVLHIGLVMTIIVCFVSISQNLDDHMLK